MLLEVHRNALVMPGFLDWLVVTQVTLDSMDVLPLTLFVLGQSGRSILFGKRKSLVN